MRDRAAAEAVEAAEGRAGVDRTQFGG